MGLRDAGEPKRDGVRGWENKYFFGLLRHETLESLGATGCTNSWVKNVQVRTDVQRGNHSDMARSWSWTSRNSLNI